MDVNQHGSTSFHAATLLTLEARVSGLALGSESALQTTS